MRIFLLDKNPKDMRLLEEYINKYADKHMVKMETDKFTSCEDFLAACENTQEKPYLVIISMELGSIHGIEVAQRLRANGNPVRLIFTDTTEDNAMAAFEVMADGYIKKPLKYEDFSKAMKRFSPRMALESNIIEIRAERSKVQLHTSDILYAESSGHSVWIYSKGGNYKTPLSMTELFEQLQNEKFFLPCGRSFLVNMKFIKSMDKETIVMDNGDTIQIPVRIRKAMMEKYNEFMTLS